MTSIGSLFSGCGGLDLGLERSGLGTVIWQCEISEFCRAVLAKHWPHVERFSDVTTVRRFPYADVICGGFPCVDVSSAGKRRGLAHSVNGSGLWHWFARVIDQVRPKVVVVENVASGARRWLPKVRGDLHLLGYDSTAVAISAADVGAPHLRRRIFVVAHSHRNLLRRQHGRGAARTETIIAKYDGGAGFAGDAHEDREPVIAEHAQMAGVCRLAGDTSDWATPPVFRRVDDGVRNRVDRSRLRALGNAVVPQCAEVIGRMILDGAA